MLSNGMVSAEAIIGMIAGGEIAVTLAYYIYFKGQKLEVILLLDLIPWVILGIFSVIGG